MAKTRYIEPVIRFCAIISSDPTVRQWAWEKIESQWGAAEEVSATLPFVAGGHYDDEMGAGLSKVIVAFGAPIDPAGLADWKLQTNAWELEAMQRFAGRAASAAQEPRAPIRPLNLDPGYLTQAKLVLATVKDRDHRVYLHSGIFGEITLTYTARQWIGHRWTYPDYRSDDVFQFATACRERLRRHLKQIGGFRTGKKNSFLD